MAQERVGFYGKFQAQAADTSGADRMRSLAGLIGQTGDLAFQIGAKKRTEEGKLAGLEEGRLAASEGRATEKKGGGFGLFGNAYDQAAQGSYISSIGLESKEKINQLAIDNVDDPEAFGKLSQEYLKGVLANASPEAYDIINEDVTNRIGTIGGKLQSDHKTKVIDESNDTMTIAKDELAIEASTFARHGDSGAAERSKKMAFATIDQLVVSGGMKGPAASEAKRTITRDITEQKTSRKFDDIADKDGLPAAFSAIEALRNEIPKGHSPDEWDAYISSAQTDLGRKASRLTEMKAQTTAEDKATVKLYIDATELGFDVSPEDKARAKSLATTPELKEDFARANRVAAFSVLSAKDRDAIVSSSQTGKLIDFKDYRDMLASDEKIQEEARKDGYSLGVKQGLIEDIPFDANDPESLAAKAKQAKFLSSHFGFDVSLFSDEEATALADSIDDMDYKQKTQLALTLSSSPEAWGQIASKNQAQFAMAGAIGDTDVMMTIFKGQDILDAGNLALKLPRDEYMPVFNDLVEDVYGTENKSAMLKSALAYYAASGDQEMFDDGDFKAAIEAVSGGIGEINSYKVELPRGVFEDDFEDFIDEFSIDDIEAMGGVSGYTLTQAQDLIQNGRIKSVGSNRYEVIVGGDKLMNAEGKPFTLSYTAEVQRKKSAWDIATASKAFMEGSHGPNVQDSRSLRKGFFNEKKRKETEAK